MDTSTVPDMYDEQAATSANFDRMIKQSAEHLKADSLDNLNRIRNGQPTSSELPSIHMTPPPVATTQTLDEELLTEELRNRQAPGKLATSHMHKFKPVKPDPAPKTAAKTAHPDNSAAILEFAGNNDLNVATIARQAKLESDDNSNEVVVSLR